MKSSIVQRISTQRRERKWEQDCSCERWIRKSLRGDWLNWRLQGNGRLLSCHSEERIQVDDVSLGRAMQSCIATVQCDNARDWVLFYGAFNKSQLAFCEVLESLLSESFSAKNYKLLCKKKHFFAANTRSPKGLTVFLRMASLMQKCAGLLSNCRNEGRRLYWLGSRYFVKARNETWKCPSVKFTSDKIICRQFCIILEAFWQHKLTLTGLFVADVFA